MKTENDVNSKRSPFRKLIFMALAGRCMPLWVAVVAVLLTLPSLGVGLLVDDYHHKILMSGSNHIVRVLDSPFDMFRFFDGNSQRLTKMMDYGFLPWYTHTGESPDALRGAFWRPLASITHWLDYIIWPESPPLMHLHSILWYAALVVAAACLYRRLIPAAWLAGLAALLFAVDDAHSMPAAMLANRNALMASFFGILTILTHDHWRRSKTRLLLTIAPLLLAMSLLSAEAGISTCAYLAAYEIFLAEGPWRKRILSLAPYVLVVLIWRTLWTRLGYGISGVSGYIDPLQNPLEYLSWFRIRAAQLLFGQLTFVPADIHIMVKPKVARMLWYAALLFMALVAFAVYPLLKRDRVARFWTAGMLLSVLPICSTWPADRLLTFVGVGAMGLLAQFLVFVFTETPQKPQLLSWRVPASALAILLVFTHLVVAPPALALRAAFPMGPKRITDRLYIPPMDSQIESQDLIVVNPPISFFGIVSLLEWHAEGWPMPRHLRVLTSSLFESVTVHRPNLNTLVVRPTHGYCAWVLDALFRSKEQPFHVGDRVRLTGMTVEITAVTGDGRAAEAAFTFDVPLEEPSLRWLQCRDGSYVPFSPPAVGETLILAGERLF